MSLIEEMAGTWDVEQRMGLGAGSPPVQLAPAVAERQVLPGGFLEERMFSVSGEPFLRIAIFNRNTVSREYEYFSIDSRAPQMMMERGVGLPGDSDLVLYGGMFVAPQWGERRNACFRYRLTVGKIADDRQRVQLFLTPVTAEQDTEFLAFEYLYARHAGNS